MNLSPDSSRVALFDSPVEVTKSYAVEKKGKETEFRQFSVPPFDYEVSFRRAPGNSYVVSFALTEIHAEGPELAAILSRLMGRDVPVAKAELWKRQFNPVGVLNTGNASQVLGSVVRIIRDFVEEKKPSCLALNAMEPSRKDLYRRMVRSIARGAQVEETQYGFQICLPSEISDKKTAMTLTSSYQTITAVFDTPVEYQDAPSPYEGGREYRFQVGEFGYLLRLSERKPGSYALEFKVDKSTLNRGSLQRFLEKKIGHQVEPNGDEVTRLLGQIRADPHALLGTGQAYQVFSQVLGIVRDVITDPTVQCMTFSAAPPTRAALYTSLINRYFPGYVVTQKPQKYETYFTVCRPGSEQGRDGVS